MPFWETTTHTVVGTTTYTKAPIEICLTKNEKISTSYDFCLDLTIDEAAAVSQHLTAALSRVTEQEPANDQ